MVALVVVGRRDVLSHSKVEAKIPRGNFLESMMLCLLSTPWDYRTSIRSRLAW